MLRFKVVTCATQSCMCKSNFLEAGYYLSEFKMDSNESVGRCYYYLRYPWGFIYNSVGDHCSVNVNTQYQPKYVATGAGSLSLFILYAEYLKSDRILDTGKNVSHLLAETWTQWQSEMTISQI